MVRPALHTAADNRTLWNNYDWSNRGDEWTKGTRCRDDTTDEMIPEICRENGLRVVNQSTELVNQGDVLSMIDRVA